MTVPEEKYVSVFVSWGCTERRIEGGAVSGMPGSRIYAYIQRSVLCEATGSDRAGMGACEQEGRTQAGRVPASRAISRHFQ